MTIPLIVKDAYISKNNCKLSVIYKTAPTEEEKEVAKKKCFDSKDIMKLKKFAEDTTILNFIDICLVIP